MGPAVLICAVNCSFPHWVLFSLRETEAAVLSIIDGPTDSDVSQFNVVRQIASAFLKKSFRLKVKAHFSLYLFF